MRARRASGGREGELVQRAARLRKNIDPLLPTLSRDCPTARFDRLREALEAVRSVKEDSARLEKLSRRGEPLARALAGLLKFYLDPETPALLVARFPTGEVSFAPLARTDREAQIAVQQFDDPQRLLLGYLAWARKGYHFFTTDRALYCTGTSPAPPDAFRTALLADLPYRLEPGKKGAFVCTHLARGEPVPFVAVEWPGASTAFRVCRRCAKADRQLLSAVTSHLAVPKPERVFPFEMSLNVDCRAVATCRHGRLPGPSRRLRKGYLFGRL
ncbi:MAG TPA: hypothetical protein VIZ68_03600, partial [Thermoplasmata archaeon]